MNAYQIMRKWDEEAGLQPRSDIELDQDVPASVPIDYIEFKQAIEDGDLGAILAGRLIGWGLLTTA